VILFYALLVSCLQVGRNLVTKILLGVLFILALVPVGINLYQEMGLEISLYGPGILSAIPMVYLQPTYLLLHVFVPFFALTFLFLSLGTSKVPTKVVSRGFSRSLAFLFCVLTLTGFAVLQKGRVFHVLNFIIPERLDVGAVEIEAQGQKVVLQTKNYKRYGGDDSKPRMKMSLKQGRKDSQFLLQVVDEFDFPIKNLSKRDLVLHADGNRIKKYRFKEDDEISLKKGSYILTVNLDTKDD